MQKITTFLWFDHNAEAAVKFYASIFKKAKVLATTRYGAEGPGQKGSVMTIQFELFGQRFVALNGGPHFRFTPAISLVVNCKDQREIDYYWRKLSAGGKPVECGWLEDKFGLSWQIVPQELPKWIDPAKPERASRVMKAIFGMKKLDIKRLKAAYADRPPVRA